MNGLYLWYEIILLQIEKKERKWKFQKNAKATSVDEPEPSLQSE